MKIHLKFNHDADCILEALDCPLNIDQANEAVQECVIEFMGDENMSSGSHFAELIHNKLDYSLILYFATMNIRDEIGIKKMKRLIKDMLDDEDI